MIRRAVLAAALAAVALAAPAAAAPGLEIGMEDERLLLDEPARAPEVVAAWQSAGVDVVRIHARWSKLAPAHRGGPYDWTELDRAIGLVRAAGMQVMLSVTGPGPVWTSRAPWRDNPRYKPDPRLFGAFAEAVARRYGDRVDRYLVWNEPNIPGWLDPQLSCRKKVCTPAAPHLYRELVQAAVPAIKAADPGSEVLIGELAPVGRRPRSARSAMAPLPFLRALACVDERYRPIRTGPCRGFRPVYADAIGHHPHGVLSAPDEPSLDPGWAKMGDLPRLFAVLDRLTAMRRLVAPAATGGRFMLHLTEFGYQTSPPDHAIGITLGKQSRWLQQAAYLAWRDPRVRSLVHYQWEDETVRYRSPGSFAYAGWQSGLLYVNGKPKPALATFEAPLVADSVRGRLWGQVRPGGRAEVTLLRRQDGEFRPVTDIRTDERGYWTRTMPIEPGAEYRFSWTSPDARHSSGVVTAGRGRLASAR